MCKVIEDMLQENSKETQRKTMMEIALRMLRTGKYALEEIVSISGLPLDEVKKLQAGQGA